MRPFSALFILLALCGLASPAASEPTADLSLAVVGDRIEATYVFSAPVNALQFPLRSEGGPAADVRITDEALTLREGQLRSDHPFSHVTLSIGPDRRERDSVYPLATPLPGWGHVVYLPHLMPEGMTTRIRLPERAEPLESAEADGYVLVGKTPEDLGVMEMAASTATPEGFRAEAARRAEALITFYATRMERPTPRKPVILLSYSTPTSDDDPGGFRGDVSSNGVVFLRVRANGQAGEAGSLDRYTRFLAHEIFHLWNASRNPDRLDWWLHEGAAEYASWTAMASLWPEAAPSLQDRLTGALSSCSIYLGDKPLNALSDDEARAVRYPCGAVLNWLADLGARADGAGDAFTLWRALVETRDRDGRYTSGAFLTWIDRFGPSAAGSARDLMEGRGTDRWARMGETANGLGAEVIVGGPAAFPLRMNASRALVLAACREVHGVGDGQDGLFVQAPLGCDAFGDMTFIISAGGVDPATDPARYYETLRDQCMSRADIEVVVRNDGVISTKTVHCDVAVDPVPAELVVRRALPSLTPTPTPG